ncbi:MAG: RNA methyltransferase [Clostridia bacterium]|nr:RNA methyltransferase [Clostridia bacterium]
MLNEELKLDIITSKTNSTIIKISKLNDKKYRNSEKLFLCDGIKLFKEAVSFYAKIKYIIVKNDAILDDECIKKLKECLNKQLKVICVNSDVFNKITTEQAPQGIITVCEFLDTKHRYLNEERIDYSNEHMMFLESIRDPGNLGTIIRNSVAFGYDRIILTSDCVDLYSPKVIRATMGAIFKIKIDVVSNVEATILNLKRSKKRILASSLGNKSLVLDSEKLSGNDVVVIGNEGHGVSNGMLYMSDDTVFIPMEPNSESLNASVAATIFMWEQYKNK